MTARPDCRILVVDDDDANRYFKAHVLRDAGYRVGEASRGAEALSEVESAPPDLVLLDIRLPDISGHEVCRAIKARHPGIVVLQTSAAYTGARDRAIGLEGGADSYLVEPLEPGELIATVRALLRLGEAEQALRGVNETLEKRVAERTRELAEAHRRLAQEVVQRAAIEEILRQAEKLDALGQLTGGVAHDFNNLLTVVIGNLDLVQDAVAAPTEAALARAQAQIRNARRAALDCESLTGKLLAFARRDSLRSEIVDLNAVISRFLPLLQRALGERITLRLALAPELWPCRIDPKQFEAALLNLAVNARDAMPLGGPIDIATANLALASAEDAARAGFAPGSDLAPGAYVRVGVADRGTGMSEDVLARVFEPFFTTKDVGQGSGLGLSQVHGFVKQSGGHVALDTALGRGTRVDLLLPRAADRPAPRPGESDADDQPPRGSETVLIVEDNEGVLETAVAVLANLGYRVLTAIDGRSALDIVDRETPIDLLFTDLVMPNRISGVDLARQARQRRPGLKVLMTSGYSARQALAMPKPGEFPALRKPYSAADLARGVRAALDG